MVIKNSLVFILFFLILKIGYTQKDLKENVVAKIGEEIIIQGDVDAIVEQELYDEFYRIYIVRKIALDDFIKNYLIEKEARKLGKSGDEFLNDYFKNKINEDSIRIFAKSQKIDYVPKITRSLNYYHIESDEGARILVKEYKNYLIDRLVDSLKKVSEVKIYLAPPLKPRIELSTNLMHVRGNLNSECIFILISDLECSKCRENDYLFNKIYNKYKDNVKFEFIHFASYVSLCAMATECASKQNRFWEMKDSIMNLSNIPDTSEVMRIAENLNLDIQQFKKDLNDSEIRNQLESNYEILKRKGIYAVPTILINGNFVFDPSSFIEIDGLIQNELLKK